MKITRLRTILKNEYHLGARKIDDTRYGVTANGDTLFSLDITRLKDDKQAREIIQHELDYLKEVATRRFQ